MNTRFNCNNYCFTEIPKYPKEFFEEIKKAKSIDPNQKDKIIQSFIADDVIIILVINDNEYKAVCYYMEPLEGTSTLLRHKLLMTLGTLGGCKTVMVRAEMGAGCGDSLKNALNEFKKARIVIAVGVAYGVSSDKAAFGDVIVSKEIYGFANARINPDLSVDARQPMLMHQCNIQKVLTQGFTFCAPDWEGLVVSEDGRKSKIHVGTIVSCSFLVDQVKARDAFARQVAQMVGGEMEGYELLKIQHEYQQRPASREIGVMIVKGISDFADGEKGKEWQLTAAMAATDYVKTTVSEILETLKSESFTEQ